MFVVLILIILVTCALVKYILEMCHNESYVRNLKCKQPFIPFFGNALSLMGKTSNEIFNEFVRFATQNQTPLKMYVGSKLIIILDKPEDLKAVLTTQHCLDKPYLYGFYPCPQGIATEQCGVLWKRSRKLMNPSFNLKTLQSFIPIFNKKINKIVEKLKDHVGKSGIDTLPYTNACTLDAICATLLGLEIDSNFNKEYIENLEDMSRIKMKRLVTPWAHFDFIYRWTNLYKQQQKRMANIRYLTHRLFEEQIKNYSLKENNDSQKNDENSSERNSHQFIDPYINGNFSDEVMKQQIETIINGGFETTGATTAYVILMLAIHPNIQEQVFDELHSVFKSQEEEITLEHIQSLHLLDRVIKETMRLFPFGPFIKRISSDNVPISNSIIPKGTYIAISFFTLHRRKDIWGEHANEFNPDNFLPEKVQSRHPFAFLPFSAGPRNCIGYQYAMFSMKVMLSDLLRNYKFSTDAKLSDIEFKFEVTLKLAKSYKVKIAQRNW